MMLFVFLSCVHAGALREPRFSGSTQNERLNDKAIAALRVHAVVPAGATFLLRRLLAFPLVHSVTYRPPIVLFRHIMFSVGYFL